MVVLDAMFLHQVTFLRSADRDKHFRANMLSNLNHRLAKLSNRENAISFDNSSLYVACSSAVHVDVTIRPMISAASADSDLARSWR